MERGQVEEGREWGRWVGARQTSAATFTAHTAVLASFTCCPMIRQVQNSYLSRAQHTCSMDTYFSWLMHQMACAGVYRLQLLVYYSKHTGTIEDGSTAAAHPRWCLTAYRLYIHAMENALEKNTSHYCTDDIDLMRYMTKYLHSRTKSDLPAADTAAGGATAAGM